MCSRLAAVALGAGMLGACSGQAETPPEPSSNIACALGGAADFGQSCTMERAEVDGVRLLVIHHPDGGFRRFELGVPGRGIITADGMEQAEVEQREGEVEVRVGADRYILPVAQ